MQFISFIIVINLRHVSSAGGCARITVLAKEIGDHRRLFSLNSIGQWSVHINDHRVGVKILIDHSHEEFVSCKYLNSSTN